MFQGTDTLRGHNENVEMTQEQWAEYEKCSKDIFHFANYFYILTEDGELPIKLREYQERLIKVICGTYFMRNDDGTVMTDSKGEKVLRNNRIITVGHQAGKTTIATLYILWYALFHKDKTIAVLANKESQAIEIMLRIRAAVLRLPMWLQQGINPDRCGWSQKSIGFDNGCKIFCAASSSSAIRGKSVDLMLVDEFAHLPEQDADDFMMSVIPTQASRKTSMLILISTPKGMNQFYKIWQSALAGINTFVPAKIAWNEIDGRDETFRKKVIRDHGIKFFNQEYACLDPNEEITVQDEATGIVLTDKIGKIYELWQDGFLK